jgi:hypothetical protein
MAAPAFAASPVTQEYRLKAAFLYRFPQFVEWPARALDGRATVDLCVVAPNPFGAVLDELVEGETLGGRVLRVRQLDGGAQAPSCHVVFLPGDAAVRRIVLRQVATVPVLTVSDSPQFLNEGGIIQLSVVDNRVRFEINASAADRAGLRLSSQLLRLALNVRRGPS